MYSVKNTFNIKYSAIPFSLTAPLQLPRMPEVISTIFGCGINFVEAHMS